MFICLILYDDLTFLSYGELLNLTCFHEEYFLQILFYFHLIFMERTIGYELIYSHEDLHADTLQKIVEINDHETVYQNIDRVIWDYHSGVTFVIAPKGRITGMRGLKA